MKQAIKNTLAAILGLILTPVWLPITLTFYLIDKWRKKEQ
tara:strand:+ start:124 stop:243 length:120 start_codon:yes stop_codon:yes gene_type:complete